MLDGYARQLTQNHFFHNPKHSYTQALLKAVPSLILKTEKPVVISGSIPNLIKPPTGCRFEARCIYDKDQNCVKNVPKLVDVGNGHFVACEKAKK